MRKKRKKEREGNRSLVNGGRSRQMKMGFHDYRMRAWTWNHFISSFIIIILRTKTQKFCPIKVFCVSKISFLFSLFKFLFSFVFRHSNFPLLFFPHLLSHLGFLPLFHSLLFPPHFSSFLCNSPTPSSIISILIMHFWCFSPQFLLPLPPQHSIFSTFQIVLLSLLVFFFRYHFNSFSFFFFLPSLFLFMHYPFGISLPLHVSFAYFLCFSLQFCVLATWVQPRMLFFLFTPFFFSFNFSLFLVLLTHIFACTPLFVLFIIFFSCFCFWCHFVDPFDSRWFRGLTVFFPFLVWSELLKTFPGWFFPLSKFR